MLSTVHIISESVFVLSLKENVVVFSTKDTKMHSARVLIMMYNPIYGIDTPYQSECGVSFVYLVQGLTTTFFWINRSGSTLLHFYHKPYGVRWHLYQL